MARSRACRSRLSRRGSDFLLRNCPKVKISARVRMVSHASDPAAHDPIVAARGGPDLHWANSISPHLVATSCRLPCLCDYYWIISTSLAIDLDRTQLVRRGKEAQLQACPIIRSPFTTQPPIFIHVELIQLVEFLTPSILLSFDVMSHWHARVPCYHMANTWQESSYHLQKLTLLYI
jgi:hypothetical protein